MIIIYLDIVLLIILLCLTVFTCGYCVYRVYRLQQTGQVTILLRPTKVLFSHKKEGESNEELRTVVAYQNPFTGDYCVHKSRAGPKGYVNSAQSPDSADSGLSDEYEPLHPAPPGAGPQPPPLPQLASLPLLPSVPLMGNGYHGLHNEEYKFPQIEDVVKRPLSPHEDNTLNKTWNWNYKEYQI